MKVQLKKGSTSNILQIFIADSSSTTGAGLTGLTNASAGLTAYYHRDTDTTATAITLVTMTVGTFTSSGFKEIDATNMPGWYQFCPPNAAFASGAASCAFHLKGATNMAPLPIEVELVAYDPQDSVRLGLTALPNAAAEAAGGLYTRGTGAGQINQPANGQIDANTVKVGGTTQTARDLGASVLISSGTGTGQLDVTSGVIKANLAQILGTALTETAGQIAAAFKQFFDVASPTGTMKAITNVVTTTNLTTNNDKTGYSLSSAGIQAIWDALTSALTTVGSIGKLIVTNLDAAISSRSTYAGGDTSGTTTLLSRIASALTITSGKVDVNDKTGFRLSAIGVDDVWDEAQSGHTSAGTFGKYLDAQVSSVGGGTAPTAAAIADAVWDEKIDDHLSDRSFGMKIGIHLPVQMPDISYRKIKEMVDEVGKKFDSMPQPEKVDLIPIVEGLHDVINEVRSLPKPQDQKETDLSPVLDKIEQLMKEVGAIEIPEAKETDLSPILDKMSESPDEMKALVSQIETILQNIRSFFSADIEDIKGEVSTIRKEIKRIPAVMMRMGDDNND